MRYMDSENGFFLPYSFSHIPLIKTYGRILNEISLDKILEFIVCINQE